MMDPFILNARIGLFVIIPADISAAPTPSALNFAKQHHPANIVCSNCKGALAKATCLVVRVRIFVFFVFQLPLKPWHQGDLK